MYTLIIRRMNGSLAHKSGPYSQSWNEGGDVVDKLIEDPGVVSNAQYTLIINVTTIGGHTQNLQNFGKFLYLFTWTSERSPNIPFSWTFILKLEKNEYHCK